MVVSHTNTHSETGKERPTDFSVIRSFPTSSSQMKEREHCSPRGLAQAKNGRFLFFSEDETRRIIGRLHAHRGKSGSEAPLLSNRPEYTLPVESMVYERVNGRSAGNRKTRTGTGTGSCGTREETFSTVDVGAAGRVTATREDCEMADSFPSGGASTLPRAEINRTTPESQPPTHPTMLVIPSNASRI